MSLRERLLSLRAQAKQSPPAPGLSGESLLELIIALGIFLTIMAPLAGITLQNVRASADDRNDLIAGQLVEEGVEAMHWISETNARRFSPKGAACWNTKLEHTELGTCEQNRIKTGTYRLGMNVATYAWILEEVLESQREEKTKLFLDERSGLYTHRDMGSSGQINAGMGMPTLFSREITVDYGNNVAPEQAKKMKITSLVTYRTGTLPRKRIRVSFLTAQEL